MSRTRIQVEIYAPIGPYSHAVAIGRQLFVSGTAGVDPDTGALAGSDAFTQTRQVLRNIEAILRAAGATFDDVGHVQVNLLDMADFAEMNRAYAEFFAEPLPARTVIGVSSLPKPGARLTMNAVAVRKGRGGRRSAPPDDAAARA
jgi:2-iminobutanoate/2-iminopropanoate deaminase